MNKYAVLLILLGALMGHAPHSCAGETRDILDAFHESSSNIVQAPHIKGVQEYVALCDLEEQFRTDVLVPYLRENAYSMLSFKQVSGMKRELQECREESGSKLSPLDKLKLYLNFKKHPWIATGILGGSALAVAACVGLIVWRKNRQITKKKSDKEPVYNMLDDAIRLVEIEQQVIAGKQSKENLIAMEAEFFRRYPGNNDDTTRARVCAWQRKTGDRFTEVCVTASGGEKWLAKMKEEYRKKCHPSDDGGGEIGYRSDKTDTTEEAMSQDEEEDATETTEGVNDMKEGGSGQPTSTTLSSSWSSSEE